MLKNPSPIISKVGGAYTAGHDLLVCTPVLTNFLITGLLVLIDGINLHSESKKKQILFKAFHVNRVHKVSLFYEVNGLTWMSGCFCMKVVHSKA